jgi:hypothetical protein
VFVGKHMLRHARVWIFAEFLRQGIARYVLRRSRAGRSEGANLRHSTCQGTEFTEALIDGDTDFQGIERYLEKEPLGTSSAPREVRNTSFMIEA